MPIHQNQLFIAGILFAVFVVSGCRKSPDGEEEIRVLPEADFTYEITSGTYPVKVTFESTAKNAETFLWSFGNGRTSTLSNPVDSFAEAGTYKVKLVCTNNWGVDSITKDVQITLSEPKSDFDFVVENDGQLPCNVTFTNKSVNAYGYTWLFEDGDTLQSEHASKEFSSNGVYRVRLVAKGATGSDTSTKSIRIHPKFNSVAVYLITPRDNAFNQQYYDAVGFCLLNLNTWYKEQMGNGKTFELNPLIVDTVTGLHDSTWYNSQNGEFSGTDPRFYGFQNTLHEMQLLFGEKFDITKRTYVVYVASPGGGAGYTGFTALGDQDLKGLLGINPDNFDTNRWIGGAGHELGHAFGLPHPANELHEAIMWTGYLIYPNCILQDSDRDILNQSSYFK